jgi:hypothetical protein
MAVTACSAVFNTVELLEEIAFYLPCREVLSAKRVSQLWNNTINGSAKIQMAMCLRPLNIEPLRSTHALTDDMVVLSEQKRTTI